MRRLQPEDKIKQNDKGEYICSECGNYLTPYYVQDGPDDYKLYDLQGFHKCFHEKNDEE